MAGDLVRKLWIFTPSFYPGIGGAAQYSTLLAKHLKHVSSVRVLTEKIPSASVLETSIGLFVYRILPFRTNRKTKDLLSFLSMIPEQIILCMAVLVLCFTKATLCIHSAYFTRKYPFYYCVWIISRMPRRANIVLDLRDKMTPVECLRGLREVNSVVVCSDSVEHHYLSAKNKKVNVYKIPVPIEMPSERLEGCDHEGVLRNLPERYLFFPHGFFEFKGVDQAVLVTEHLRANSSENRDIVLVVCGRDRYSSDVVVRGLEGGYVVYLGMLSNHLVPLIAKRSVLMLNFSRSEGMPRSVLEAIAVGARVLLPSCVPEFQRAAGSVSGSYSDIRGNILATNHVIAGKSQYYSIDQHLVENVINLYTDAFFIDSSPL